MKYVHVTGNLPPRFAEAFALLKEDLKLALREDAFPVTLTKGDGFSVVMDRERAGIVWSRPVEVYRGFSLLCQNWGGACSLRQTALFQTMGVMFDVSRNAVLKPETLRFFLRKMALMGLNLGMLYTEDTYEVPEYPYFGYLRGKYTQAELRALDDYADILGIELCPCIQTLAHLNRALHWPQMAHMKDTEEVLLAEDPDTMAFIRSMIVNASAPYRSKRIHIGMDEAHFLGLGAYLRKHGYTDPFDIMERHLKRVAEIVREEKLNAMMWSDMYFRLASPTGGYYDAPEVPQAVIDKAPEDLTLVYWDYYHQDAGDYGRMMELHRRFAAPKAFACCLWTFPGPAPHYQRAVETLVPGLQQAKEHGIPLVFATLWGDNGAECNLLSALYAMTIYSEFCYTGSFEPDGCSRRFRQIGDADAKAFWELTRFNQLPGVNDWWLRPVNASKFLLYQDPIAPMYDKDLEGVDLESHYAALEEDYREYRRENPAFGQLLGFYEQLARTLRVKCAFHQRAGTAVRAKDRAGAAQCAGLAGRAAAELEELRKCWRALWYATNRPYGFEVIDIRVGGAAARMESAKELMEAFARNELETIEPLAEEPLPYTQLPGGCLRGSYAWGEIASPCKVDL